MCRNPQRKWHCELEQNEGSETKLMRIWESGDLLREALTENHHFPLRLSLKTPDSTDLSSRFDAVRSWAAELAANPVLRLEFREVKHRVQGSQRLPTNAWIDSLEGALNWLNKHGEWNRFLSLVEVTRRSLPGLLPWLENRPLEALELADEWPRLLAAVAWLVRQSTPQDLSTAGGPSRTAYEVHRSASRYFGRVA